MSTQYIMSTQCVDSVNASLEVNQFMALLMMGYCDFGFRKYLMEVSLFIMAICVFMAVFITWLIERKKIGRFVKKVYEKFLNKE